MFWQCDGMALMPSNKLPQQEQHYIHKKIYPYLLNSIYFPRLSMATAAYLIELCHGSFFRWWIWSWAIYTFDHKGVTGTPMKVDGMYPCTSSACLLPSESAWSGTGEGGQPGIPLWISNRFPAELSVPVSYFSMSIPASVTITTTIQKYRTLNFYKKKGVKKKC